MSKHRLIIYSIGILSLLSACGRPSSTEGTDSAVSSDVQGTSTTSSEPKPVVVSVPPPAAPAPVPVPQAVQCTLQQTGGDDTIAYLYFPNIRNGENVERSAAPEFTTFSNDGSPIEITKVQTNLDGLLDEYSNSAVQNNTSLPTFAASSVNISYFVRVAGEFIITVFVADPSGIKTPGQCQTSLFINQENE